MIDQQKKSTRYVEGEPTVSSDDLQLYGYGPKEAPKDVVINIGSSSLLVAAPHAVNDPQRMEVGDRRRGAYYLDLIGKMPGLMPLHRVDEARVKAVNKIRDIRVGNLPPDWVAKQRRISEQKGEDTGLPFNPHNPLTPMSPLARAANQV